MFNKKIIVPLIAVVVLLLALLAVTMIDDKPDDTNIVSSAETDENEVQGKVLDFDTSTVSRIYVKTSDESFGLIKNDDKWIMENNENASISSGSVNMLVSSLDSISYTDSVTDGSISAVDCGITDEADYISFTSELGEVTVTRGMTTTDGTLCYVMTSLSEDIYFADATSVSELFKPLKTYRNGAALKVDFDNLNKITVNNDELITLEKGNSDKDNAVYNEWKMLTPVALGANDETISTKIVDFLKTIKIQGFASDNGNFSDFGMGDKSKYISLTDSSGKTNTVYFSSQLNGKYYISVDDSKTIYEVALSDAPYISLKAIDLADRNINLAKMTNISMVTLKGADIDYTVEFLDEGGKINGTDVSKDAMNQSVFTSVCGLMADDIYTGSVGATEITMNFEYKDSTSDTIVFSSYNDRYYAVSKNGYVRYLILKTKLSDLTKLLDNYR